ncbi:MAG TPA: DUF3617 family protein [Casimicrobiaceae bacterium]|jgi:hypothetical protein|nr:DUF3617 family protein [Casimicrobiaceae bacterium]
MRFLAPSIVTLAMLAALAATPAGATLNMNEGLWETTVSAEGRAHSASAKCYTRTDIAEMERLLRGKSSRVDGICRYADFTQSGDSVNYTMTCRLGDDEQTSAVSATYRGDSAIGTIRSAGVTVTASSRRIGSCTESSFAR